MGSFASLLGGMATGARDAYGEIDKQRRDEEAKNNSLVAEALHKEITTNEQLTPDEQDHLFDQYLQLHGIKDKKVRDGLRNAAGYHRQALTEAERKAGYGKQQPQLGGDQQSAPATTVGGADGAPDVSLPAMPMAPTAGIPQLPAPPYQPKTAGQLKFEEAQPRIHQAEHDKAEAARQEARAAAIGTIDDKIEILKKYKGDPMEAEVRQLIGAAPKGAGAKSRALAGTMSGEALKREFNRLGIDSSGINESSSYRASVDADGKILPDSVHETEQATRAGTAAIGSSWIKMFPADAVGNPVNESAMYVPIRSVNSGRIIAVYPVSELGSQHAATNYKTVQMKDGSTSLVPVTEVSSTTKTVNGVPVQNSVAPGATPATAQVAPPLPAGPQAQTPTTMAPETRPTPGQPVPRSATPSTPLPKRGGVGQPVEIPGAGKAFTPEQTQANQGLYQAVGTTENRLQQVLNNADLLDNPISAARIKIAMSMDTPQQALSRISGLTNREAKVAALFKSLKEDINIIRKQYNATAFRGPQALDAMQGVAGDPLSNPKVTRQVIAQTVESLGAQKKIIENAMKSHNVQLEPYIRPADSYKNYAKNPANNHVIGTDDGRNWYDVNSGALVK